MRLRWLVVLGVWLRMAAATAAEPLSLGFGVLEPDQRERPLAGRGLVEVIAPPKEGVVVSYVLPRSPAARAGITRGDIVALFARSAVRDVAAFDQKAAELKAGQSVDLQVYRYGVPKTGKGRWLSVKEKLKPAPAAELLANALTRTTDPVAQADILRHPDAPSDVNVLDLSAFIVVRKGQGPELRLRFHHVQPEGWLNVGALTLRTDMGAYESPRLVTKSDAQAGLYWEWLDLGVDARLEDSLREAATSKAPLLRLKGTNQSYDRELILVEKERLATVLAVYDLLRKAP